MCEALPEERQCGLYTVVAAGAGESVTGTLRGKQRCAED